MIFFEIFLGMIFGFILGLIPSLHINVLAYLLLFLGALSLISNNFYFLFSFAIAMTIFGIVPLLIFNIPTADNFTLNLGQQSNHSISPYIFGSLFGSFFAVLLLPLFYLLFSVFSVFYFLIFAILFFVLIYLVVSDSNWLLAFMIAIFSGLLGVVTLKYNFFFSEPLLPCIFGLFALPALVVSLFNTNVNSGRSKSVQEIVDFKPLLFLSFLGSLFSSVIAIVPSLSPGMAQVFPAAFSKKRSKENREVLLSSTLISVILIYFFMAAVFRKSRLGFVSILLESGVVPAFSFADILLLGFVFLFVVSLSCFLLYFSFPKLSFLFSILPRRSLLFSVVVFSTLLIVLVTNIYSIFLIFLSFLIGLLPIVYNKNKLLLMSYLIVPTILFYI